MEQARRLDHPFTLALALVFAAAVHQARREPADVRHRAGEAASIAARNGFSLLNAWATALDGWALSETGSPERAVPIVEAAVAASLTTGSRQFSTLLHGLLAEALVNCGRPADALLVVDRALAEAAPSGQRFHEAELLRLRGELLEAQGRLVPGEADAETVLLQAVDTADTQGAHLFALRASVSLARLWSGRGRTADARALIARAYAGMPEDDSSRDAEIARQFLRDARSQA